MDQLLLICLQYPIGISHFLCFSHPNSSKNISCSCSSNRYSRTSRCRTFKEDAHTMGAMSQGLPRLCLQGVRCLISLRTTTAIACIQAHCWITLRFRITPLSISTTATVFLHSHSIPLRELHTQIPNTCKGSRTSSNSYSSSSNSNMLFALLHNYLLKNSNSPSVLSCRRSSTSWRTTSSEISRVSRINSTARQKPSWVAQRKVYKGRICSNHN